jgi:hypothetical protein
MLPMRMLIVIAFLAAWTAVLWLAAVAWMDGDGLTIMAAGLTGIALTGLMRIVNPYMKRRR